jgi:hypothetical protein
MLQSVSGLGLLLNRAIYNRQSHKVDEIASRAVAAKIPSANELTNQSKHTNITKQNDELVLSTRSNLTYTRSKTYTKSNQSVPDSSTEDTNKILTETTKATNESSAETSSKKVDDENDDAGRFASRETRAPRRIEELGQVIGYEPSVFESFLNYYDNKKYARDMDIFIADRRAEQEVHNAQIIENLKKQGGTTNFTFETVVHENDYWDFLQSTGKSFYSDTSQDELAQVFKEPSMVFFGSTYDKQYIGFVEMGQQNNIADTDENTSNNTAKQSDEKQLILQQIESNVRSIISSKLAENGITLNAREGFLIDILDDGTVTLGENTISDNETAESIKNLIETDETFQQSMIALFAQVAATQDLIYTFCGTEVHYEFISGSLSSVYYENKQFFNVRGQTVF